ncbi:MAG: multidrug effflux MFS transporter [Gammaproteobacteria bacterium]|nr:multidrug effflux MFS transporter [Gammaproteobacteria bacterium]MDH5778355.1 multidrug effflux MFS transporter [Gammaproteobacteria bacterium]
MSTPINNKLVIVIIAMLAMIAPFCIDTYLPAFPSIATDLGASAIEMQQTLSLYLLGYAVMTLFCGAISDALGRRRVILVALIGFVITTFGLALAENIELFLLLRLIQGGFASVASVVGRAVVRDLFHGHQAQQVMAIGMVLFGIAPAVAPIIGGMLEISFGWRSIFVFLIIFGFILFIMVSSGLKESLPKEQRHSMHPIALLKNYLHALSKFHFLELCLIIAFNFGGIFLFITAAPQVMFVHLGLTAADFHIMFVPIVAGMMFGAYLSSRTAGRMSVRRALQWGYAIMFVGAVLSFSLAYSLPVSAFTVVVPLMVYSVGMSFCMPMLSILCMDELPNNRGLASSLQTFVHMCMGAIVAGAVVPLVFDKIQYMATTLLLMYAVALLMFINVNRRKSLEYVVEG